MKKSRVCWKNTQSSTQKNVKGQSCAPSICISPCLFSNIDKYAKCAFLLVFICFSLISTPYKY